MNYTFLVYYSVIFFLPAYVANAMPVIANGLNLCPSLAKPIHEEWFGKSKTYRGFIFGIIGAFIINIVPLSFGFYDFHESATLIIFFWTTFTLSIGALLGDLAKSFFKRRVGIKSGHPWPPFDQLDYVIGALLFSYAINPQPLEVIVTLLILSPLLSLFANVAAYILHLKKVWW
ncbi:CDP-2,3-bis-(O-geranylgeranyl)-sn-glycerol synthase [Candidatus Peregrinibacteria bacterium]|nr:CDP-2,3-bis-(O-geranylgeranyl)-sn-glycerol synthase [Candidatus Peregrinibacteria bacterium]